MNKYVYTNIMIDVMKLSLAIPYTIFTFLTLLLKLYALQELFPFKFHFMHSLMKITFSIICSKYLCCNFLYAIKLSSDIYKVQIYASTNYQKIIFQFVVRFNAIARSGTIFSVVREITRIKKPYKRINLEANRQCAKGLLHNTKLQ